MRNRKILLPQIKALSIKVEESVKEMEEIVEKLLKYESNVEQAENVEEMEVEEILSPQIIAKRIANAKSLENLEENVAKLDEKQEVMNIEKAQIDELIILEDMPDREKYYKWKHQDIINPSKFRAPSKDSNRSNPYRPNNKWVKDGSKVDRYNTMRIQSNDKVWTPNQENTKFFSEQKWKMPEHPESTSVNISEFESLSQY